MAKTAAEKLLSKHHPADSHMVPFEEQNITKEKLKALLPRKTSVAVTDEILHMIHNIEEDVGIDQESAEENIMSYMHLIGTGSNGVKELVNAIKFCTLKRNYDNKQSWSIIFPEKYDRLVKMNKQVDNHVSAYNNSKLVVAIDKEMLIPVHLQYAGYFHAAVKKQFELMNGKSTVTDDKGKQVYLPASAMVQHLAAKELALLTAQPVETKIDVKVSASDKVLDIQNEMNEQLKALVAGQRQRLEAGEDIIDVQAIGVSFTELGGDNE